jgi:hypothetical protein
MEPNARAKETGQRPIQYRPDPDNRTTADLIKACNAIEPAYTVGDHAMTYVESILFIMQKTSSMHLIRAKFTTVPNDSTLPQGGRRSTTTLEDTFPDGAYDHAPQTPLPSRLRAATTSTVRSIDEDPEGEPPRTGNDLSRSDADTTTTADEDHPSEQLRPTRTGANDSEGKMMQELNVAESRIRVLEGMLRRSQNLQQPTTNTANIGLTTPRSPGPLVNQRTTAVATPNLLSDGAKTSFGFADSTVSGGILTNLIGKYLLFYDAEYQCIESEGWRYRRLNLFELITKGMAKHSYLFKSLTVGDLQGLLEVIMQFGKRGKDELKFESQRKLLNLKKTSAFAPFLAVFDARVADYESFAGKMSADSLLTQLRLSLVDHPHYVEETRQIIRQNRDIDYATLRSELTIFAIGINDMHRKERPDYDRPDRNKNNRQHVNVVETLSPCYAWRRNGSCQRPDCPYGHEDKDRPATNQPPNKNHKQVHLVETDPTCYAWKRSGTCSRPDCPFEHEESQRGNNHPKANRQPGQSNRKVQRQRNNASVNVSTTRPRSTQQGNHETKIDRETGPMLESLSACYKYETEGTCNRPNCRFAHNNSKGVRVNLVDARAADY